MEQPAMDPKIVALMAKLEKRNKQMEEGDTEEVNKKDEPTIIKPPATLYEFLTNDRIPNWPLDTEPRLDLKKEGLMLGTQEDIINILRDAAPLGVHMIDSLENRLEKIEKSLHYFSDKIVSDERQHDSFFPHGITFITETTESIETEGVKSHSSKGHKSVDFAESVIETRKKSLEFCTFPGFRAKESIELPGQLETPPVLDRVTKTQDFNSGFKKFWKKIFLSEASVAVVQDTFWWTFLDQFNKEKGHEDDKDLIFDRVADSFVALFTTINRDVKDKVLAVYPDCFAQSLYAIYTEAFPESAPIFDDLFKQYLINLTHEWVTGLKPVPGTYNRWDVIGLQPSVTKGNKSDGNIVAAKQMIQAAALNKDVTITLDMESFTKLIDRLGVDKQTSPSHSPQGLPRDTTKTTLTSTPQVPSISQSKALVEKHSVKQIESHQIGPGPEYERVKFNTQGRSPLISHYLYMRQLRDFIQPGQKVRRTEISRLPPMGPTYQQLIQNTLSLSNALSKEYQKICEETDQDIMELEKRKVEMNREIDALQKELLFTRNPQDLKILCEKIAFLREKGRELPVNVDTKSSDASDSDESISVTDDEIESPESK